MRIWYFRFCSQVFLHQHWNHALEISTWVFLQVYPNVQFLQWPKQPHETQSISHPILVFFVHTIWIPYPRILHNLFHSRHPNTDFAEHEAPQILWGIGAWKSCTSHEFEVLSIQFAFLKSWPNEGDKLWNFSMCWFCHSRLYSCKKFFNFHEWYRLSRVLDNAFQTLDTCMVHVILHLLYF